jgi:nucleotide-binding universal stress UspA family protein
VLKVFANKNGKTPRIVAGADGTPTSLAALRWAVGQAEVTGGTVDAVIAWQPPVQISGDGTAPMTVIECAEFVEIATKTLQEAVSEVAGPEGNLRVRTEVVRGNPAQVLLDASEGADLLVVGSRDHRWFAEARYGSVSQGCVQYAHCPVVVIRDTSGTSSGQPTGGTKAA